MPPTMQQANNLRCIFFYISFSSSACSSSCSRARFIGINRSLKCLLLGGNWREWHSQGIYKCYMILL